MTEKKMKIVMAPGVMQEIDDILMNGTDAQIAEMQLVLDEFKKSVEDGSFKDNAHPVDINQLRDDDPDLADILSERIHDAMVEMGEDPDLADTTEFFDALRHDFAEEGDIGNEYNQADAVYKWLVELAELRKYKREIEEGRGDKDE